MKKKEPLTEIDAWLKVLDAELDKLAQEQAAAEDWDEPLPNDSTDEEE